MTRERILEALAEAALGAQAHRAVLSAAVARLTSEEGGWDESHGDEEVWLSVVDGHWSILDHMERDFSEYYLIRRNAPEVAHLRRLSPRELHVVRGSLLGLSNKAIAYALGLSRSSVAEYLGRAQRKLGGEAAIVTLGRLHITGASSGFERATHHTPSIAAPPLSGHRARAPAPTT